MKSKMQFKKKCIVCNESLRFKPVFKFLCAKSYNCEKCKSNLILSSGRKIDLFVYVLTVVISSVGTHHFAIEDYLITAISVALIILL